MALSLSSPGITIREVDLTRGSVNATSSLSAGIAAPFERGPVEEVTTIRTENDLVNIFGSPSKNNFHYEYWYSASNFLSYGGSLKVVRADSDNLKNSNAAVGAASTDIKIKNYENYQETISSGYYWAAKNPGYWADGIKVCVIDNFADQTFSGISTSSISVGAGITQSITGGYLKGIVSGIGNSEFYVKVVSKVSSGGTETSQDYTERGIYSFNTTNSIYINGSLGVGVTAVTVTRAGLSTFSAASVGSGQTLTNLNVTGTTSLDMQGGSALASGDTVLYVSNVTGISSATRLKINTEIVTVTQPPTGTTVTVSRASYGTSAVSHSDGSPITILSVLPADVTVAVGVNSTATSIQLTSLGNVSAGDYLLNPASNEILLVSSVSNSGVLAPSTINDWYNQQYVLNTANGDRQTVLWKAIAPKPRTNQYVIDRGGSNDALNIAIIDNTRASNFSGNPQQILEVFRNISKASDAQTSPSQNVYYKTYLEANSRYVYAGAVLATDAYWGVSEVASKFSSGFTPISTSLGVWGQTSDDTHFNSVGNKSFTITGGKDYSTATGQATNIGGFEVELNDITSAIDKLANENEVELNFLLQGSASGGIDFEQSRANYLISTAESRKDCVAFISPYRGATVNVPVESNKLPNILSFFTSLSSSSYAVFDSGYQYIYDRFNREYVYIPCSADVAGLCVRTDINQYPWYSPAGKVRGTLKNVIKLAYNPNQDDRDELYSNRVNPIITYPGSGTILFGDKTALSYPSAFDRINVRRLFITIEQAIRGAADAQLFEFNDSSTRASFINIVEPYLRDVQAKRGITDFLLVCDETNNTPAVIDRNEFIADIYVKPARSINYIGLTFVATRTGVSFETVVGTV
jgi:hypothetical protein